MAEAVHHPEHYNQGNIECVDAIREALGKEQYIGWLRGTVIKYVWRHEGKGKAAEDAAKAVWYMARLLTELAGKEKAKETLLKLVKDLEE